MIKTIEGMTSTLPLRTFDAIYSLKAMEIMIGKENHGTSDQLRCCSVCLSCYNDDSQKNESSHWEI